MELIKQLSTDKLEQICNDGLLWNKYNPEQQYKSLLYRATSLIQEQHEDEVILVRDVLDMASVELMCRKQIS